MIIERVEFEVKPGQEDAFLDYAGANQALIESSAGCRSFSFGRGVENPSKVVFLVGWDSVAAHEAARKVPAFQEFGKGAATHISGATVEHFDMRAWAGK